MTRPASKAKVIARYGSDCWICANPIDLTLLWPDPRAFSRDHVNPRAHGGADTIDNLRPAHAGCNTKRGAPTRPIPGRAGLRVLS